MEPTHDPVGRHRGGCPGWAGELGRGLPAGIAQPGRGSRSADGGARQEREGGGGSASFPSGAAGRRSAASGFRSCRASERPQQCAGVVSELSEEAVARQISSGSSRHIAVGFREVEEELSFVTRCCFSLWFRRHDRLVPHLLFQVF